METCDDRIWSRELRVGHFLQVGGTYREVEKIEVLAKEKRVTLKNFEYPIIVPCDGFVRIDWVRAKEINRAPLGRIGKEK